MISAENDRPHLYSFVGGMVNQAWLAGIAGNIEAKSNPVRFSLYQNSNPNLALPVELKPGDYLPAMVKEGMPVKVTGHIFGRKLESGERIAVFRVLKVSTPTLLDMPGELAWKASVDGLNPRKWPEGVPQSAINPEFQNPTDQEVAQMVRSAGDADSDIRFTGPNRQLTNLFRLAEGDEAEDISLFRDRLKLRKAANVVRVAGIVDGAFMAMDMNGKEQKDTLIVLLRQNTDSERCIPVRVYNRQAKTFHDLVKVGTPVTILGAYRQRVKVVAKADTPGGVDQVMCYPYIHTDHLRVATAQDIKVVPAWAEELARKMSATARFSPPPRKKSPEDGKNEDAAMTKLPSANQDNAMAADMQMFATADDE